MQDQLDDFKKKHGLNTEQLAEIVLPPEGKKFQIDGIIFQVSYVKRSGELRFTAKPVGVLHTASEKPAEQNPVPTEAANVQPE